MNTPIIRSYTAPDGLLNDRVIAVTGAGEGIGREVSLHFAALGATVILMGRTVDKLESSYDEIETHGGPQPAIFPINLEGASSHDYTSLYETLDTEFGRLDGLLHNASELGRMTPLASYNEETWQRVMQVNTTGPFMMTKALLPLLEKSEHASVVFTGDDVVDQGKAYWGAYGVSKAAAKYLMQTFAEEYDGKNSIRFNMLVPGKIKSPLRARAFPAEDPKNLPKVESILNQYDYLFGAESVGVNGECFFAFDNK